MLPVRVPLPGIRASIPAMAVELTIEEGRWSPRRLRGFLEGWLPHAPIRVLGAGPWQGGRGGVWTWMFGEGSTRGCSLRLRTSLVKAGVVSVRLNTLASRADWTLAHGLVRGLLKAGGGRAVGADDRVLRAEDFSESTVAGEAAARLRDDTAQIARALQSGEPFAALPTPAFSLIVTAAMLPKESQSARMAIALEEHLREMAARYFEADAVAPLQLPDATSLSVWTRGDALMYFVHHVGVQHGETPNEGVVLQAPRALEIFGDRLEVVSAEADRFYVPAIRPGTARDDELIKTLVSAGQPLPAFMERYRQRQASPF